MQVIFWEVIPKEKAGLGKMEQGRWESQLKDALQEDQLWGHLGLDSVEESLTRC